MSKDHLSQDEHDGYDAIGRVNTRDRSPFKIQDITFLLSNILVTKQLLRLNLVYLDAIHGRLKIQGSFSMDVIPSTCKLIYFAALTLILVQSTQKIIADDMLDTIDKIHSRIVVWIGNRNLYCQHIQQCFDRSLSSLHLPLCKKHSSISLINV